MSADLHFNLRRAAWPHSDVPGLAPLSVTLMPEPVPAPPRRGLGESNAALAIVLTAAAAIAVLAVALIAFALHHGLLG